MERVLSQDERIRRAEELYARRMQRDVRRSATVNVDEVKSNKLTRKLIVQIIICLVIYGSFYTIKNIPNFVSEQVMYKISDVLEYDINFQELYKKFNSGIIKKDNEKDNEKENKKDENNNLVEETLSASDSTEKEKQEGKQENTNDVVDTIKEESSSLSQMEVDAKYVKDNISIIKPLTGEITSRFGIRNPTVATVPKYHTGIDIARVTGTVIQSAMEGDVELVSSEGDYGNHIKITNGEISTLYAHCSKIYVKEGEHISQGQQIAEVGATGNVTGPHLHFEIRRNNQYIDPDLILQF